LLCGKIYGTVKRGDFMWDNNEWHIDYIDSLAIVDKNFKVIHSSRYNPRFDDEVLENTYFDYINKNFFEVYPYLEQKNSSIYIAIKNNKVVYNEKQIFKDYRGRVFNTKNITIPIVRKGKVIGAIELSKDVTSIDDLGKTQLEGRKSIECEQQLIEIEKMTFDDIMTNNSEMFENIRKAKIFSNSSNPTLIYGETGTGKELFVQAMVNYSSKSRLKFIVQNCAAVPENLFESILFGSVKGAYTGAENKAGLFEQADGGILFLDELNSMPFQIQAKLLRVLQDGIIRPLGSNKVKHVNVKIIAAMNIDPLEAIEEKKLREDLFYRFSSNMIKLIPLRDRKEDILLYVNYFIKIYNKVYNKEILGLTKPMTDIFFNYEWKGNVRELKHIIESMISVSEDKIMTVKNLPIYMKGCIDLNFDKQVFKDDEIIINEPIITLQKALEKTEKDIIIKMLIRTKGHITNASELLGIPRQTLKYRMNKLNIDKTTFKKC
jgi:arginine utilization regulatory protein